jgi:L-2,4-diaminobutyrate decarboxylase
VCDVRRPVLERIIEVSCKSEKEEAGPLGTYKRQPCVRQVPEAALEAATHNPNFWNMSMELTRPARATRLLFTLYVLGLDTVGQMIDHGFVLAGVAEAELRMLPGWEIVAPPSKAIVNFPFASEATSSEELDKLNSDISKRAIEENLATPLTTKIRGVTVMRICTISSELEMRKVIQS